MFPEVRSEGAHKHEGNRSTERPRQTNREYGATERIILFGSASRGETTRNSDLDILVIKSGDYHRGKLTERIYESLRGLGAAVDIVVAKAEDIDQYGGSPALVFSAALSDGKVLYVA